MLEQPQGIPAGELVIGKVRDALAHRSLEGIGIQGEINQDATHAFALKLE
jgi:hypothetical protein